MPHRSPIVVALLFAATIAVTSVVAIGFAADIAQERAGLLFYAVTFAQLNVMAAWAVFHRPRISRRWIAPFVGGLAWAAIWTLIVRVNGDNPFEFSALGIFFTFAGMFCLHAAAATLFLWVLKQLRLVRGSRETAEVPWQFSIGHLLILMTVGCLLLTMFVANQLLQDAMGEILTFVAINFTLLAALVIVCSRPWHWLLRLGGSAAAAIALGVVCNFFTRNWPGPFDCVPYNLVQAFVTYSWFEVRANFSVEKS